MEAGTIGFSTPGVPINDLRFARLPHQGLPGGCTNPDAGWWFRYAQAYNAVVVAHFERRSPQ